MEGAVLYPARLIRGLITREAWDSALRTLLLDHNRFAVGEVQWRRDGASEEVLCRHLEIVDQLPNGSLYAPFGDWVVLLVDSEPAATAAPWLERIQPRRSQRLLVVVLTSSDPSRWQAVVWDRGCPRPVAALCIVGAAGFAVGAREGPSAETEPRMLQRSSRTVGAIGDRVFRKLRASCVTVVGAGRLGCLVAFQLAGLGVPRLRLIDPDVLELANLDAMPGLTERDVGRPKAAALARRLVAFRPDLLVAFSDKSAIDPEAQRLLRRRTDLIVTCVDDDPPRLCASLIAKETLTVHLDVATQVTRQADEPPELRADIRLLTPDRDGGCIGCVGGLADAEETLYQIGTPAGALRRGEPVPWHQQRAGSLITINSIAAGVAVQTWLDLLAGDLRTSYWHRLRWRAAWPLETGGGPVSAEPDCRFCRSAGNQDS